MKGGVWTVPRFLEAHLPQTDFAFLWDGADGRTGIRTRSLCCNQKAKAILIKHQLVKADDFDPLIVVDTDAWEHRDQNSETPPPLLSADQLEILRDEEKRLQQAYHPKPQRKPRMRNALALIRGAKRDQIHNFAGKMTKKRVQTTASEASIKLPKLWLEVLCLSNGGEFGTDIKHHCIIVPIETIDRFNEAYVTLRKSDADDYRHSCTCFGPNVGGDTYAFEKHPDQTTDDAPILLISHEDFAIERRWTNIADFVESLMTGI